jgi:uncharacterized NAD-dependent epimerase/dehydratase family protein
MAAADTLTERMDALAEALRAAGVAPDRVAAILTSAATATMNALVLDAVLEDNAAGATTTRQPEQPAQPLKRAA